MKMTYDYKAQAVYIYLNDKPYAYGTDLDDDVRIDYASDNTIRGIEVLGVEKPPMPEILGETITN